VRLQQGDSNRVAPNINLSGMMEEVRDMCELLNDKLRHDVIVGQNFTLSRAN
jgi:hypothetical protein